MGRVFTLLSMCCENSTCWQVGHGPCSILTDCKGSDRNGRPNPGPAEESQRNPEKAGRLGSGTQTSTTRTSEIQRALHNIELAGSVQSARQKSEHSQVNPPTTGGVLDIRNAPYLFTCYPSPYPSPAARFQIIPGKGGSTYHAVIPRRSTFFWGCAEHSCVKTLGCWRKREI